MNLTWALVLIGGLIPAAVAAQDDPVAPEDDVFVEGDDPPAFESFCGGGEPSVVDEAYAEMDSGNLARARQLLVRALQSGRVDGWQRGYALAMLAEVQLRLRQYGQAVVNYRKALRIDPDGVGGTTRVGLATALLLHGARRAAHREARAARDAVCADPYAQVACYAALSVITRTTDDEAERTEAGALLQQLRASHAAHAASFDEIEQRLAPRRRRTPAPAEPRT
jgi:cytochrome c-type biogenesis protein CcmH/NrfG